MKKARGIAKAVQRLDSVKPTTRVVRRLDLGELRPAIRRENGTMIVEAHLTRCGVFNYLQPDGTIRRELREPEQVFAPESLNSFLGVPCTNEHPPEMIDAQNATSYAIGAVQGDVIRDDDHVRSRLTIYDHDTAQAMQNGKRQVSLGYVCDLDETGGVDPKYGHYDARQINIRGNHCAIVDAARAGGTARVRLDAAERLPDQAADCPAGQQPTPDDDKWIKAGFKAGGRVKAKQEAQRGDVDDTEDDASRRQGRRKLLGMGMRCDFDPNQPRAADGKFGEGGAGGAKAPSPSERLKAETGEKDVFRAASKLREKTAEQATYKAAAEDTFANHAAAIRAHLNAAGNENPQGFEHVKEHRAQAGEHLKSAERLAKPEDQKDLEALRNKFQASTQRYGYKSWEDSADVGKKLADKLAASKKHANIDSMAKTGGSTDTSAQADAPSSQEGDAKSGTSDPKDTASRNAAGDDDAKPADKAKDPASGPESEEVRDGKVKHTGDDPDVDDPDDDEDDDDPDDDDDDDSGDDDDEDVDHDDDDEGGDSGEVKDDAYDASYNDDGELTPEARHKMATTSFAVPDREGLPIHDPEHTGAAMKRFNQYDFKTPDEKHAAFNRISQRAKHFGISSTGFEKANKATLDQQDQDRAMIKNEKLRKAREERDAATARADAAEGQIASLKKDLANKTRTDSAEEISAKVAAKVALVAQAASVGAKIDPTKSDIEIMCATIKHIDGDDVPADKAKLPHYVQAMFDGAIKRATKDAEDTNKGAQALAAVRSVVSTPVVKNDADDTDEEAVAARSLARSAAMHEQTWVSPTQRHNDRLDARNDRRNRDSEI